MRIHYPLAIPLSLLDTCIAIVYQFGANPALHSESSNQNASEINDDVLYDFGSQATCGVLISLKSVVYLAPLLPRVIIYGNRG